VKVSEMTVSDIAEYCRIAEPSEADNAFLSQAIEAAKAYIRSYTGLDNTSIDEHEDFVIVVYILVQDMYDNRSMFYDKHIALNNTVETILGMHSVNLL
jgi:uncharacterized phage protein (predicted DNA packaging)